MFQISIGLYYQNLIGYGKEVGGLALFEMCPARFWVWHLLRFEDMGGGVTAVIWESRGFQGYSSTGCQM